MNFITVSFIEEVSFSVVTVISSTPSTEESKLPSLAMLKVVPSKLYSLLALV